MAEKQVDLEGQKLADVREVEDVKTATIYVADNFKVRVSESQAEKWEKWDPAKKRKWLKRSMRIAGQESDPEGKNFDKDYKALYAKIFG